MVRPKFLLYRKASLEPEQQEERYGLADEGVAKGRSPIDF
jgi:hypothetical protein